METDVVVDPEVRPPEVLFDLSGRVAVVTGASSGLGRRFARVLHAAGAHVVLAPQSGLPKSWRDRERLALPDSTSPMRVPCDQSSTRWSLSTAGST